MSLSYEFESVFFKTAIPYEMCFSFEDSETTLTLVVLQNENVNILGANTEVMVHNENTFVLHPNGDLLIDVFLCQGDVDIRYATTLDKIK